MTQKARLLLGAHMSIAGGFDHALLRGETIHCTTIQMFTKGNRQWKAKPITDEQREQFQKTLKKSAIDPVIAHAMYLLNIASPDNKTWHGSMHALSEEIERCHILGIPYLVVHPGFHLTSSKKEAQTRIAQAINHVLEKTDNMSTIILLENMAGQGSSMCAHFEELAAIIDQVEHKKRVAVCLDTCHAFASGYDFTDATSYTRFWQTIDDTVGIHHIKAIHLNDSMKARGSRIDRHEEIGKGMMGLESFALLMNDTRLFDIPKILETPHDDITHYARNMHILKGLLTEEHKNLFGIKDREL